MLRELQRYVSFLESRESFRDENWDSGLPEHQPRVCVVPSSEDTHETLVFVAFPTQRQVKAARATAKATAGPRSAKKSAPGPVAEGDGYDEYGFDRYEFLVDEDNDDRDYDEDDWGASSEEAMDEDTAQPAGRADGTSGAEGADINVAELEAQIKKMAVEQDRHPSTVKERRALDSILMWADSGLGFTATAGDATCQVTLCRRGRTPKDVELLPADANELASPEMLVVKRRRTTT